MMFETRRPPANPKLPVRVQSLESSQNTSASLRQGGEYRYGAAVRLATELAEEGNFVDAYRVAKEIRRFHQQHPPLITSIAEKLISRDISIIQIPTVEKLQSIHRQTGQNVPACVTRTRDDKYKVNSIANKQFGIGCITFAPEGKCNAFSIGKQLLIEKSGQAPIRTDGHDAPIRLISISDNGAVIATYGDDAAVRIWDSENGTPITSIPLRDVGRAYLSISPSGDIICIAVSNGPARYLNLKGDGEAHVLRPRGTHATAICPLPDGRAFIVGCQDGTTRIMEMKMAREAAVLDGDSSPVIHVNASPDGRRILVQTQSGRISVFATANAERTHIWQLAPDARSIQAIFTTNDNIAFAKNHGSIITVALKETGIWQTIALPKVELTDALLIQADRYLLCGDTSGRLVKVDTKSGIAAPPIQCHRRRIQNIRPHPTHRNLVTMASWDTTASIVDVTSLEPVMMFTGHGDRVRDAMLCPDGKSMVTVSDDRTCRIWDASNGRSLHVSSLPERPLGIESCTRSSAVVIDVNGSRNTIQHGQVRPIKVEKQHFDTAPTNVFTNGSQAVYLAGSSLLATDGLRRTASSITSSDRITACYLPAAQSIMAIGTNTGHIQFWDSHSWTQLIDVEGANCQIAALGYSRAGNFVYVIGVDGHLNYLRLRGTQA